jgi:hypothetical protein
MKNPAIAGFFVFTCADYDFKWLNTAIKLKYRHAQTGFLHPFSTVFLLI